MRACTVSPSGSPARTCVEVEVAHDLDERPVGDPVPVRQAAALEHERVLAGGRDQLGGEARLADARLADDRDDAAGAVGDDPLELRQQRVELGRAPDERRVHPARDAGRVRLDVEQPPRVDRLRLPLQLERGHRLGRDGVADEADRRVADEDLAGCRGRLEPLRDDDGVAGGERIALRRVAGDRPRPCGRRCARRSGPRTPPRARRSGARARRGARPRRGPRAARRPRARPGSRRRPRTASPTNFSIVPPWRSSTSRAVS